MGPPEVGREGFFGLNFLQNAKRLQISAPVWLCIPPGAGLQQSSFQAHAIKITFAGGVGVASPPSWLRRRYTLAGASSPRHPGGNSGRKKPHPNDLTLNRFPWKAGAAASADPGKRRPPSPVPSVAFCSCSRVRLSRCKLWGFFFSPFQGCRRGGSAPSPPALSVGKSRPQRQGAPEYRGDGAAAPPPQKNPQPPTTRSRAWRRLCRSRPPSLFLPPHHH